MKMTDTIEVLKENTDSMEVSKGTKGDFSYKVKVYGDSKTLEGVEDMDKRIKALKAKAESITRA